MPDKTELNQEVENIDIKDAAMKYLKLNCFREFMKRLYYESKYFNLAKLCEEYLEELLENLDQIFKNQQLCLPKFANNIENSEHNLDKENINDISENDDDQNNQILHPITEQSEGEEDSCDHSIVGKINKIQEKLSKIENVNETVNKRYEKKISSLNAEMAQFKSYASLKLNLKTDENKNSLSQLIVAENLLNHAREDKEIMKDISMSVGCKENRETIVKNDTSENGTKDAYLSFNGKFDELQKNFNQLQEYLKTTNMKNNSNVLTGALQSKSSKQQQIEVKKYYNYSLFN